MNRTNQTNRTQYPLASGTTTAPPVTRDLTTAVDPTFIPDESDDPQRKSAPRYTLKRPGASAPDQPKPRTTAGPSPPTFKGERSVGAYACCRTNLEGTVHVGEAHVLPSFTICLPQPSSAVVPENTTRAPHRNCDRAFWQRWRSGRARCLGISFAPQGRLAGSVDNPAGEPGAGL